MQWLYKIQNFDSYTDLHTDCNLTVSHLCQIDPVEANKPSGELQPVGTMSLSERGKDTVKGSTNNIVLQDELFNISERENNIKPLISRQCHITFIL